MADSRIFRVNQGMTAELIGRAVEDFLRYEKELQTEGFETSEGYLIQTREASTLKKVTGMGKALQIQIIPGDLEEITVNIGMGQWSDKVGAAAVGMLLFTPLAITAAIGAYGQNKLPGEIFDFIERFIISGGKSVRRNPISVKKTVRCRNCGATIEAGKKFCGDCGTPV